jgi:hypothetical protein
MNLFKRAARHATAPFQTSRMEYLVSLSQVSRLAGSFRLVLKDY